MKKTSRLRRFVPLALLTAVFSLGLTACHHSDQQPSPPDQATTPDHPTQPDAPKKSEHPEHPK